MSVAAPDTHQVVVKLQHQLHATCSQLAQTRVALSHAHSQLDMARMELERVRVDAFWQAEWAASDARCSEALVWSGIMAEADRQRQAAESTCENQSSLAAEVTTAATDHALTQPTEVVTPTDEHETIGARVHHMHVHRRKHHSSAHTSHEQGGLGQ